MNHPEIEPEHVLATLVALRDGIVPGILRKLGVDQTSVTNGLQTELGKRPQPHGGARPLRRAIRRWVLDPLAMRVLQAEVTEGDRIPIDAAGGKVQLVKPVTA